jgi:hypothetical protein
MPRAPCWQTSSRTDQRGLTVQSSGPCADALKVTGPNSAARRWRTGRTTADYAVAAACADILLLSGLGIHGLVAGQTASLALASTVLSLVCGLMALLRGRLPLRYASALCATALVSAGTYQFSVRDPAMVLAIAGWMALILVFLASTLSRAAMAGYSVLAAGFSALAIVACPMPPAMDPLRAGTALVTVLLMAAMVPLVHRDDLLAAAHRPAEG